MPKGLHEDAAVRAMQVHAPVPRWRLWPLCEGWEPDLPLWQGSSAGYSHISHHSALSLVVNNKLRCCVANDLSLFKRLDN